MIGVYVIQCIPTGRFYIGSSDNIPKRKRRHLRDLRRGYHHNTFLQRVYNKYGEESLTWKCRTVKSREQALALEQHYLYSHMFNPKCMNIGVHATGGDNLTHNPNRDKIIARISASVKANCDAMSNEERRSLFGLPGKRNGMYGKTHSKKTRRKMSEVGKARGYEHLLGIRKSEQGRRNIAEAARARVQSPDYVNPFKGKTHTAEVRARLSAASKGRLPPNIRRVKVGRRVFGSVRECAQVLGVCAATVCYRINSTTFPDYTYKD